LWREGKVIGIEVNIIIRRRRHPPRQNDYDDTPFSFDRDMKLARLTLTRVYFNADQSISDCGTRTLPDHHWRPSPSPSLHRQSIMVSGDTPKNESQAAEIKIIPPSLENEAKNLSGNVAPQLLDHKYPVWHLLTFNWLFSSW
jgi:hypothetical protein